MKVPGVGAVSYERGTPILRMRLRVSTLREAFDGFKEPFIVSGTRKYEVSLERLHTWSQAWHHAGNASAEPNSMCAQA